MPENIFPSQWKTEFQSYVSQKLLESARKKKQLYKVLFLTVMIFKIQKGIFPAVGIKTLFFLFILLCLFYFNHDLKLFFPEVIRIG